MLKNPKNLPIQYGAWVSLDTRPKPQRGNANPILSIIIPVAQKDCWTYGNLNSIATLLNIKNDSVEIIVIFDGVSCNDLQKERFSYFPNNCLVVSLPKPIGANPARFCGVLCAQGDFVHFHDCDDELIEGWDAEIIDTIRCHPRVDLIVTPRLEKKPCGDHRYVEPKIVQRYANCASFLRKTLVFRNCIGPIGGIVVRKGLLSKDYFKHLPSSQDWYLYQCLFARKNICCHYAARTYFVYYRGRVGSISSNPRSKVSGAIKLCRFSTLRGPAMRVRALYILDQLSKRDDIAAIGSMQLYLRQSTGVRQLIRVFVNTTLICLRFQARLYSWWRWLRGCT